MTESERQPKPASQALIHDCDPNTIALWKRAINSSSEPLLAPNRAQRRQLAKVKSVSKEKRRAAERRKQ
jgi:hypothetical protein